MAKYALLNFPTSGQVNPTLTIVQELAARGEEVVYFNFEKFRTYIEAMGAKFIPYDAALFRKERSRRESPLDAKLNLYRKSNKRF
jgi:UDP:flavonoid glycosyltransferase YjiC (YdhE family)